MSRGVPADGFVSHKKWQYISDTRTETIHDARYDKHGARPALGRFTGRFSIALDGALDGLRTRRAKPR